MGRECLECGNTVVRADYEICEDCMERAWKDLSFDEDPENSETENFKWV